MKRKKQKQKRRRKLFERLLGQPAFGADRSPLGVEIIVRVNHRYPIRGTSFLQMEGVVLDNGAEPGSLQDAQVEVAVEQMFVELKKRLLDCIKNPAAHAHDQHQWVSTLPHLDEDAKPN
jgi:hypothetical protein